MTLRCVTYLAAEEDEPGLPRSLFAEIAAHLGGVLGCRASLEVARCGSGPRVSVDDAFSTGHFDVGWVCAPSMLWLHERGSVNLVPAGMLLDDPRCAGRPEYRCEVVVREDHRATSLDALRGGVAAFNDPASLSGFGSLLRAVAGRGGHQFFGSWMETGSHARSIAAVRSGEAAVAAVGANVWRGMAQDGLRVLESLGPFPIQPMVVRRGGPAPELLAEALLRWRVPGAGLLQGFSPVRLPDIRARVPWAAIQSAWTDGVTRPADVSRTAL